MSDDIVGIVLVLLQEVVHARECNLIDVFVDFLFGHTDTAVADGDSAFLGIEADTHGKVAQFALELTLLSECLELLSGIDSVRHHFTKENLMIAIEKLFDDGEDVLCSNPNITFLHDSISYVLFTMTYTLQIACQSSDAVIDF